MSFDRTKTHARKAKRSRERLRRAIHWSFCRFGLMNEHRRGPTTSRGAIYGLNPTVTATEIMRSLVTASFYRLAQILKILRADGHSGSRIVVSGGILRSPESIRLLADSIGHDVEISRVAEASLRGAAIFALEQQGIRPRPLPAGKFVKHDRALARLHAERRAKQEALERRLTSDVKREL